MGLPTILLLPTTTARFPATLIPLRCNSSMTPSGVYVLLLRNTGKNAFCVEMRGKRQLHKDTVHTIIVRKRADELFHRLLRGICGHKVRKRTDPSLLARPDLVAHIDLRRGILAHQNDGKADFLIVPCLKVGYFSLQLGTDLRRDFFSVDERHELMIPPRTPFTKSAERSVEYLRASDTASDTDTTGGTSSR